MVEGLGFINVKNRFMHMFGLYIFQINRQFCTYTIVPKGFVFQNVLWPQVCTVKHNCYNKVEPTFCRVCSDIT